MKFKATFLLLLFITSVHTLFAHALWIETYYSGEAGQTQEVKLYYGEYSGNEREEISKWYSDVKDCSLWLIGPDKQKVQLKTSLMPNYALASFTPATDGVYTLLVSHDARELGGTTRYVFMASATVRVGRVSGNIQTSSNTNELRLFPQTDLVNKVNVPVKIKAFIGDGIGTGQKISVFSPSGWSREIVTGTDGTAEFTPLWPGKYVLEITDYKKTTGQHNGKNYEAIWKGATYSLEILK
ncbi:DUF4198 domain-containing protein [Pedobacter sp. P351]|uniref:DUF4198 domain-containing protein n=1 Tax=Pedobacter superstes TaxID=3133441 RepID=UPI0030A03F1C